MNDGNRNRIIALGRLFGLKGVLCTLPFGLFVLAQAFFLKRAMLMKAGSLLSELDTFRVWRSDLMFFGIFCFVLAICISSSRKALRGVFIGTFSAAMFVSGVYQIANFYYYEGTGATLSREVLTYWFRNMGENQSLLFSEARLGRLVLLGAQVLVLVLSLLVPRLKGVRRWAERTQEARGRRVLAAYLVAAIALEVYSFVPPLTDVHPALEPWAPNEGFVGGPAEDEKLPEGFVIPATERMDAPLELEKDAAVPAQNVVLIIFESISWKNSDVYTQGKGTTPFLADLARRGALIDRIYTVVPHTTKALVPILCGIYPYLEVDVKEAVPGILPERGLAHILRKEGYATAFFQTANNYEGRNQVVANMGFETFKGVFEMPAEGFADTNYFGKEERMMLGPSLDWAEAQGGRPFFLTYLTLCTHHNYETPATWPLIDFGVGDRFENQYLNAVRYTDEFIKEVMTGFEKRGLAKDTLFIIVGDHGEAFNEHREKGHNITLFEEGLRSLGLLYAPGLIPAGSHITGYRSILDIVPTVCDFLGLRVKEGSFIGESLFKPVPADRGLRFSGWSRRWVLAERRGPDKIIYWPMKKKFEVFDNDDDPLDQRDLSGTGTPSASALEAARAEMSLWADIVDTQYLDWEKAAKEGATEAPLVLKNAASGTFGGLVSLVGYEAYPTEIPRARIVWLKLAFRSEARILRPIVLSVSLAHENGKIRTWTVPVPTLERYEKLEPGRYFSAETFLPVPLDWPTGDSGLYVGFLDRRSRKLLAVEGAEGASINEEAGVRLRTLKVLE